MEVGRIPVEGFRAQYYDPLPQLKSTMNRVSGMTILALSAVLVAAVQAPSPKAANKAAPVVVQVYKSASCGCCKEWIKHMRAAGFDVRETNLDDYALQVQKDKHGIRANLRSCHTAKVGDYVLEGHVPAADVRRLLAEHPQVVGLAVPGMPKGSPGMEMPDGSKDKYEVVAFTKSGATRTFARY